MSSDHKPNPPSPTPDRRAAARRTAWVLGGVAFAVYAYAMFKTLQGGAA